MAPPPPVAAPPEEADEEDEYARWQEEEAARASAAGRGGGGGGGGYPDLTEEAMEDELCQEVAEDDGEWYEGEGEETPPHPVGDEQRSSPTRFDPSAKGYLSSPRRRRWGRRPTSRRATSAAAPSPPTGSIGT